MAWRNAAVILAVTLAVSACGRERCPLGPGYSEFVGPGCALGEFPSFEHVDGDAAGHVPQPVE